MGSLGCMGQHHYHVDELAAFHCGGSIGYKGPHHHHAPTLAVRHCVRAIGCVGDLFALRTPHFPYHQSSKLAFHFMGIIGCMGDLFTLRPLFPVTIQLNWLHFTAWVYITYILILLDKCTGRGCMLKKLKLPSLYGKVLLRYLKNISNFQNCCRSSN